MFPVLLVGGTRDDRDWLARSLGQDYRLLAVHQQCKASRRFIARERPVCVLAQGVPGCAAMPSPSEGRGAELERLAQLSQRPVLLLNTMASSALSSSAWFVLHRSLRPEWVRALIESASSLPVDAEPVLDPLAASCLHRTFQVSRRLALQTDLAGAEQACISAVLELLDADRAQCLFFDAQSGALWSEELQAEGADERHAACGLLGFVARTGKGVQLDAVDEDPRWVRAMDGGSRGERLLAQPVSWNDRVHAVLVAHRGKRRPTFDALQWLLLQSYAEHAAPLLEQLSQRLAAEELLAQGTGKRLFRAEALHRQRPSLHGEVLRVSVPWLGWLYWALCAVLCAGLALLAFARAASDSAGEKRLPSHAPGELDTAPEGGPARAARVLEAPVLSPERSLKR
jgi:hypothetical protein